VVEETLLEPIELQILGLDGLKTVRSQSAAGVATVVAHFRNGYDPPLAYLKVQNAVSLAAVQFPDPNIASMLTFADPEELPLLGLALVSPDGRYDSLYMGKFARIWLEPELRLLDGVASCRIVGAAPMRANVWLDPDKLAARGLTAADIARALLEHKSDRPNQGLHGLPFDPDIAVSGNADGHVIRLGDIARFEFGRGGPAAVCRLDCHPAVYIGVTPARGADAAKLSARVGKLAGELRKLLPDGLMLIEASDFHEDGARIGPNALLIEVEAPAAEDLDRTLARAEKILRALPGVTTVLSMAEPDESAGRVLVGTTKPDDKLPGAIRRALANVPDTRCRVLELGGQRLPKRLHYPIRLDLTGDDREALERWARRLADDMAKSGTVIDIDDGIRSPTRTISANVDRQKAIRLGVKPSAAVEAVRIAIDDFPVGESGQDGTRIATRVRIPSDTDGTFLRRLKVRSDKGEMVPLGAMVTVREVEESPVLSRRDGKCCLTFSANPASGVKASEAATRCREAAEKVRAALGLPDGYRARAD
jgi:multidrug efflux pump subunit AcrB